MIHAKYIMVDGAAVAAGGDSSAPVENVSELKFGNEFKDIHILSNAQVAVILQVSARSAVNRDEELNEVYRKTQKYVDRFNSMMNPEKEHQVRVYCAPFDANVCCIPPFIWLSSLNVFVRFVCF